MKIYHNPRCRKSRETLQLLLDAGYSPTIIEYLKTPPSVEELRDLIDKLGIEPMALIRKQEAIYKEQFKGQILSDEACIAAMVVHPKLMERPIVVKGDRAVIGRPPEAVLALL